MDILIKYPRFIDLYHNSRSPSIYVSDLIIPDECFNGKNPEFVYIIQDRICELHIIKPWECIKYEEVVRLDISYYIFEEFSRARSMSIIVEDVPMFITVDMNRNGLISVSISQYYYIY